MGEIRLDFFALLALKIEKWRKSVLSSSNLLYTFPFLQEINEGKHDPDSHHQNKVFHKSQFLQKLSCPKLYWDQARLSSLVNKQVAYSSNSSLGLEDPMSLRPTILYPY